MTLYKYQGAGNDFVIIDNYDGQHDLSVDQIRSLCDRRFGIGADGLIFYEKSEKYDFKMRFFNADGSCGMMCGNGGRCIIAFAASKGLEHFVFEAPDGVHSGSIISREGNTSVVRLKMMNVTGVKGYFMNTGCRHLVVFKRNVADLDVVKLGRKLRYKPEYAPEGTNVDFVQRCKDHLFVRTYEKGIEVETLACGTGVVATAIAAYIKGIRFSPPRDGRYIYPVYTTHHQLSVEFTPDGNSFNEIYLTGEAVHVFTADQK